MEEKVRRIAETSFVEGTTCALRVESQRAAMEVTEKNLALWARINEINEACGLPYLEKNIKTGGSDAADMTVYGLPVVDSLGVRGDDIHTLNESALIASLAESAKQLAAIVWEI